MGSQPPLLSRSDCVKLGLIGIKGSTSLSAPSVRNSEDMVVHQLQSSSQGDSDTTDWNITATTLQDTAVQEPTSVVSGPPCSTLCFFYKNLFYKNVEAEINQNFKNVLRTCLRLRVD